MDAMISFTSTTVDDFAVMLYFMALAEKKHDEERSKKYISILIAFFIGYSIVGALALISLLFGLVMSKEYIALAGFVPLFAGFHKVYESLDEQGYLKKLKSVFGASESRFPRPPSQNQIKDYISVSTQDKVDSFGDDGKTDDDDIELAEFRGKKSVSGSVSGSGLGSDSRDIELAEFRGKKSVSGSGSGLGSDSRDSTDESKKNSNNNSSKKVDKENDSEDSESDDDFDITGAVVPARNSRENLFLGIFSMQLLKDNMFNKVNWEVLAMTLAAGSDHVVIYNAMLEEENNLGQVFSSIAVYYIMLVVHVVAAIALIRCKFIAKIFQDYSIIMIIFLLIGTGLYILKDSILFVKSSSPR